MDSRIKNIAPTRDQISDTVFFKFKPESDIYEFYTGARKTIDQVQDDIITKTTEFSASTGTIGDLTKVKDMIASGNNGVQAILAFDNSGFLSMNSTQVANKANERSALTLDTAELLAISGTLKEIKDGLNALLNYMDTVSVANVQYLYDTIIQSEKYKNQNVEILADRKSDLTDELNAINTDIAALKAKFILAKNIYTTTAHIQNQSALLAIKKLGISSFYL